MLGDRVAVARPGKQRAEDQQIERAAQQLDPGVIVPGHRVETLHIIV
jgi:hypothetical protein